MPTSALETVRDLPHLESLVAASFDRPLVLFKHSRSCGTSHHALDELRQHLAEGPRDAAYAMVTVQEQRALSDAVAQHFGVRHETPQALVIRDGRVTWRASHFRVTATALASGLAESGQAAVAS